MKSRRRKVLELGVGLGFLLTVVLTLGLSWRQSVADRVRSDTIRLHVLANSDTIEDQLLKLKVRDAILEALPASVTEADTPQQAVHALKNALPALQYAANRAMQGAHSGQTAVVRLEEFDFDAKNYGTFALPGGTYTALRVELGAAQGHNWFCVLYPALCVSGATAEYPTKAENALVFGRYEVRLALLDALQG
ncbi:MAG: stage II sporulation protein R [Gemmiger sp.]|uniref:Stage II sporulation protein R n=1 Tax=Subdoligranulum variabile TaxID=214851 RepID=A0A921IML0_9FIRM|nr:MULTISPECIES: stage II sporulation protein R [Gemmiger]MBM6898826.1 stage II sporulation protein R [Gemmiger formicilis]MEE0708831.1 stage II sporulation protein R [Gemmiger sp.]HJG28582.1 stage II sporulation protein R [Subdoligranulum variabile]